MNTESLIGSIVTRVKEKEAERKGIVEALRGLDGFEGSLEGSLVHKCGTENSATVVGVDGGLLTNTYHGIDIIVVRAVGVKFVYKNGKLVEHSYFPSEAPVPEIIPVFEGMDTIEFAIYSNLVRVSREIETAYETVKKSKPEALILHGPLTLLPSSKPSGNGILEKEYERVIESYKRLYQYCETNGIILFGVVEDSKGVRFGEIVSQKLGRQVNFRDTVLLYDLLGVGERTFAFKYSLTPGQPVLRDLGPWARKLNSFYLKTVKFDRPLRVDFLSDDAKVVDKIAALLCGLSGGNKDYGLPTVIVEADLRAKLRAEDIDIIYDSIAAKSGTPITLRLRREGRPF